MMVVLSGYVVMHGMWDKFLKTLTLWYNLLSTEWTERVETINPSVGPSIRRVSKASPSQTVSLDTSLNSLVDSEAHGLGPGPPSPASINFDPGYLSNLHCNDVLPETNGVARKRFGLDLGRLGRKIRQRLLCGFLQKEGTNYSSLPKSLSNSMPYVIPINEMPNTYEERVKLLYKILNTYNLFEVKENILELLDRFLISENHDSNITNINELEEIDSNIYIVD